jgi:hypothetical protein
MTDSTVRTAKRSWMFSVFGDVSRAGSWRPLQRLVPVAVFGDVELDLREADLTAVPGDVTITAVAPFGDIQVLVPDGVHVELGGLVVFGSKKVQVRSVPPTPTTPVVRVKAWSLFGSARVWGP